MCMLLGATEVFHAKWYCLNMWTDVSLRASVAWGRLKGSRHSHVIKFFRLAHACNFLSLFQSLIPYPSQSRMSGICTRWLNFMLLNKEFSRSFSTTQMRMVTTPFCKYTAVSALRKRYFRSCASHIWGISHSACPRIIRNNQLAAKYDEINAILIPLKIHMLAGTREHDWILIFHSGV